MGLKIYHFGYTPFLCLLVYIPLVLQFHNAAAKLTINFLKAPKAFSNLATASFDFEVRDSNTGLLCFNCDIKCQLDNSSSTECRSTQVTYTGLKDGNHTLTVCANASLRTNCSRYDWAIDTIPPTAYVTSRSPFTNDSNVPVRILFSEPCSGGGGFVCNDNDCNLLVHGTGHVIPSTLQILQPALEYSLMVAVSADEEYGRLVLVMDKKIICKDAAGNSFTRSLNSSYNLHYDKRAVTMNITSRVPQKPLDLNGMMRTVEATNDNDYLKIYVEFSEPVLNSSQEILPLLRTSGGTLVPTYRNHTLGNRRFGYFVNGTSNIAIVTVSCEASSIISRQGTPLSSPDPLTFLYDAQRPSVKLTTYRTRTTEHNIPVLIKFVKPVFDFNSSAIMIWGGQLLSFHETSRSIYAIQVKPFDKLVTVEVSENATQDIAGNKNLASNLLEVRHYSIPVISTVISLATTILFLATAAISGLLTISTSSLILSGALSRPTSLVISEPTRSLLRIACHVQLFALTRWLTINLPIEYYEFTRGIEWIIPHHSLPWDSTTGDSYNGYSVFPASAYSQIVESNKLPIDSLPTITESSLEGKPLTPMEYRSFLENQDMKPEAQFPMISQKFDGWNYFGRNMFWLAVIGGGFVLLHIAFLLIFAIRKKKSQKQKDFGALVFPRFEIFLIILSLPCICQASTAIIKGGTTAGLVVGIALIGIVTSFLIALLIFLSIGITMGKVLQYKEVHQEGQTFHWYQEIVRRTLGPGKRGQWTWKSESNSVCLTKLGLLFEDLRGPPKYMLSQIASANTSRNRGKRTDQIIASDDENEDAEAPFIQKLFGILRIYYTLLDAVKRVAMGIVAGAIAPGSTPSKAPTILVLSITSFQLFFVMLKKPFIKKKVQLVEIIAVASEVCIFAFCLVLLQRDFTEARERIIGIAMLAVFVFMFTAQMMNEWYALYRQVKRLSQDKKSFAVGLKTALIGILLIVLPMRLLDEMNCKISSSQDDPSESATGIPANFPESSNERSWLKQLREMAKASFSRENVSSTAPNDPSSSNNPFWGGKRSGSASMTSSTDAKAKVDPTAKSKGLYKDLETIFSSK
ncbi:Glutathione transport system permease protein gsiD [Rhynchospora pubera]|uniref:Glutathione transport system permease protein gsiD n=1 Tax=Rhynchospora pubera TaxID=906938 RepID=A0AAV8GRY6_9POAL|nr:Glutathione transport system permease protein gsiD [Rhynchospora pubera]